MSQTARRLARSMIARHRRLGEASRAKATDLRPRVQDALQSALERCVIDRAWLIGSLTTDHFGPGSDVDVVVQGLTIERAQFQETLSRALGHRVDLLCIEQLPESFQQRVLEEGLEIDVA